ncbi:MAG: D-alanine--D-alanine ligase, partial [Clostridia bacterium]|nr:D-alanine--D-alanine ligase [Clostridia bacterium]
MKINVAVFFGCRSVEHEVSIISAVQAMRAMDSSKYEITPVYVSKGGSMYSSAEMFNIEFFRDIDKLLSVSEEVTFVKKSDGVFMHPINKKAFKRIKDTKIDLAFPIVHGTNCEDGTIAGYFEFLGLPYISCDIISAAVGMDKAVFKDVLKSAGLPVLDCVRFTSREYMTDSDSIIKRINQNVSFPLIIKPVNLGSSVGISKVKSEAELDEAIRLASSFADKILAERAVENLREINCSVLGDVDECIASVCEEPIMHDEILSYKDKYEGGSKSEASKGMASLGRKIPADIPAELSDKIKDISCKIFKALGASGVVRIDYLLDNKTGEVFANEINTVPGSLAFYLWEASGI